MERVLMRCTEDMIGVVEVAWKVEDLRGRCNTELSDETSNPPFVDENDHLIKLHKIALATSRKRRRKR
ncbi:hypothetical protein C5167_008915 [Papaver somniferum]|uniref:Uncharacterized protein n=1 Tax=Papaver somniferum TaxID=3469 RepID=A0A4Y7JYU3_PAPSO|nr:hypothetical protein C5167_008915 [Papaver somniferum]